MCELSLVAYTYVIDTGCEIFRGENFGKRIPEAEGRGFEELPAFVHRHESGFLEREGLRSHGNFLRGGCNTPAKSASNCLKFPAKSHLICRNHLQELFDVFAS